MADEKKLILRKAIKKKKPAFMRQEGFRRKKLEKKWRQPKGMHSKMRRKQGAKRKQPSPSYSSPREVKGLSMNGLKMIRVSNVFDADRLDPKNEGAIVANIGARKKVEVLKKLIEKKVTILNILKPEEFIKKVQDKLDAKKKELKVKQEKKKKSKEESLKRAEEKKKEEEAKSEEEKEEETKEEKRKILEKKE